MFGVPKSINILNKINYFHSKDKNCKTSYSFYATLYTIRHKQNTSKKKEFQLVRKIVIKKSSFHQIQQQLVLT